MKKTIFTILFISSLVYAKTYEMPPIELKKGEVPIISDEQIELCVGLYNKVLWLSQDIDKSAVNQYDRTSVSNYNNKVKDYLQLAKMFNSECANKLASSIKKATENLNRIQKLK